MIVDIPVTNHLTMHPPSLIIPFILALSTFAAPFALPGNGLLTARMLSIEAPTSFAKDVKAILPKQLNARVAPTEIVELSEGGSSLGEYTLLPGNPHDTPHGIPPDTPHSTPPQSPFRSPPDTPISAPPDKWMQKPSWIEDSMWATKGDAEKQAEWAQWMKQPSWMENADWAAKNGEEKHAEWENPSYLKRPYWFTPGEWKSEKAADKKAIWMGDMGPWSDADAVPRIPNPPPRGHPFGSLDKGSKLPPGTATYMEKPLWRTEGEWATKSDAEKQAEWKDPPYLKRPNWFTKKSWAAEPDKFKLDIWNGDMGRWKDADRPKKPKTWVS